MARSRGRSGRARTTRSGDDDEEHRVFERFWRRVTWIELEGWAGQSATRRGRSYARSGRVSDLARAADGGVLAWVQGSTRDPYAVHLGLDASSRRRIDRFVSHCSCPVGTDGCKHAVAVAVAWMEALEKSETLPSAAADDPRPEQAREAASEESWEARSERAERDEAARSKVIDEFVEKQGLNTLRRWVLRAARELPAFEVWLGDRRAAEEHDTKGLLRRVRDRIATISPDVEFSGGWGRREVFVEDPDWDGLERSLGAALEAGLHDEILELVPEIVSNSVARAEWDRDEMIGLRIGECLEAALHALDGCSLSKPERILLVYELAASDDYGFFPDRDDLLKGCAKADWSIAADRLRDRAEERHSREADDWRRRMALRHLEEMLERAGRSEEAEDVWVREAARGGSALPLVERLLGDERWDDAVRTCLGAMEVAEEQDRRLHDSLRQAAAGKKDWALLAALRAEVFRSRPSEGAYRELCDAARKARCLRAVRSGVRTFLETGEAPHDAAGCWGLPPVPAAARLDPTSSPSPAVRLDVALVDGTPTEILSCHDRLRTERGVSRYAAAHRSLAVAHAVAKTHPKRALAVFEERVEALIARTNPRLYREAVDLLRTIRPLDKRVGLKGAWRARVLDIRERHYRKPRLRELLDGLLGRPVSRRSHRGK